MPNGNNPFIDLVMPDGTPEEQEAWARVNAPALFTDVTQFDDVVETEPEGEQPVQLRRTLRAEPVQQSITHRQRILMERAEQAKQETAPGYWASLGVAAENEWLSSAAGRINERESRGYDVNPEFKVSPEQQQELFGRFDDKEMKYLLTADSQPEFDARQTDIKEDRERNQKLMEAGVAGMGASFTMAMLDPSMILLTVATGGYAIPARMSRMAKAVRYAGLGAAESAAVETVLVGSDTQRGAENVIIAGIAGAALGGTIGMLRRVKADSADEGMIRTQDHIDTLNSASAQAIEAQKVVDATITVRKSQVVDSKALNDTVEYHGLFLQADAAIPTMTRQVKKKMKQSREALTSQIAAIKAEKIAAVAKYWSKIGVTKGYRRQWDETGAWRLSKGFDDQMEVLHMRLDDVESNFAKDASTVAAKKELKEWNAMTPEQKLAKTFPNGTPAKKQIRIESRKSSTKLAQETEASDVTLMESNRAGSMEGSVGAAKTDPAKLTDERIYVNPTEKGATGAWLDAAINSAAGNRLANGINWGVKLPSQVRKFLFSDYTNLDASVSEQVHALKNALIENPQGPAAQKTAAMLTKLNDMSLRYAQGGRLQRGFEGYLKEQGIGMGRGHMAPEHRIAFENLVARAVKSSTDEPNMPESVRLARDGVRAQFKAALELRRERGEYGFADSVSYTKTAAHSKLSKDIAKGKEEASALRKENPHSPEAIVIDKRVKELEADFETLPLDKKINGGIQSSDTYFPDVLDGHSFDRMLYQEGIEPAEMIEFLKRGYLNGDNALSDAQAKIVAEIKFNNMTQGKVLADDVHSLYRANSLNEAATLLKRAGLSQDKIDQFVADVGAKEDWSQVSNRARKSLKIDWDTEMSMGLDGKSYKISDVMNTNVSQVTEAYTRESSFGAAMAELGIKSEASLERILQLARGNARNDIAEGRARLSKPTGKLDENGDPELIIGSASDTIKAVDDDFGRLEDIITQLRGQSLVAYAPKSRSLGDRTAAGWNATGRRILDATGILRLQQVGFASLPELSNGIVTAGLGAILRAIPESGMFRLPGKITGRSAEDLKHHVRDMREVEDMLGFVGEDNFINSFTVRGDDVGSEGSGNWTRMLDNSLEGTRRASAWASGFQTIQGGFEKITARAMNSRLKADALGTQAMNKSMRNQIRQAGMSDERWTEISSWLKSNRHPEDFNGSKVDTWNFEKMPPEYKRDLQIIMSRMQNRSMQKGMIGETNSLWLGANGRFLTQFRNYSLVSMEKQFIAGMRGDKAGLAAKMMWGTGLAYFAYGAQTHLRAMGKPEDQREQYVDERMGGATLGWGVLNKSSQLAALGIGHDIGTLLGVMPDEMYDNHRHGYRKGRIDAAIPGMGLVGDVLKTSGSVANLAYEGIRQDGDVAGAGDKAAKDIIGLMPFMNTIYVGEAIKTAADLNNQ